MANVVLKATAVHTDTGRVFAGTYDDIVDGDPDTYWGCNAPSGGTTGFLYIWWVFEGNLAKITDATFRSGGTVATASGASQNSAWWNHDLAYSTDGKDWDDGSKVWTYIFQRSMYCGGDCYSTNIWDEFATVNVEEVDCIRARNWCSAYKDCNPACGGGQSANGRIYELVTLGSVGGGGYACII